MVRISQVIAVWDGEVVLEPHAGRNTRIIRNTMQKIDYGQELQDAMRLSLKVVCP